MTYLPQMETWYSGTKKVERRIPNQLEGAMATNLEELSKRKERVNALIELSTQLMKLNFSKILYKLSRYR